MTHSFRPAKRENTQLIIGGAGASGSGKTYSLLLLAVGLAYPEASSDEELRAILRQEGRNRICFLDTERGRALHYAPPPGEEPRIYSEAARREGAWFPFDHAELTPPFRPDAYTEMAEAADKAGYAVIIIDSGSHEWAGEGGVLEWHEEEQEAAAQRRASRYNRAVKWDDYEAVKMTAWIKPKMAHKKMVGRITTLRAHLLIALRAEEKVRFVQEYDERGEKKGKEKIVAAKDLPPRERWSPICEKAFPHELTLSFVLAPEAPGVPNFIKLQDQHKPFVQEGQAVTTETGRRLAGWARGAKAGAGAPPRDASPPPPSPPPPSGGQGERTRRSPEELVQAYKDGLRSPPNGKVSSMDELREYQAAAQQFLGVLKDKHPELHSKAMDSYWERKDQLEIAASAGPSGDDQSSATGESADREADADSLFGRE